jgi:hypothetical protein
VNEFPGAGTEGSVDSPEDWAWLKFQGLNFGLCDLLLPHPRRLRHQNKQRWMMESKRKLMSAYKCHRALARRVCVEVYREQPNDLEMQGKEKGNLSLYNGL